MVPKMGPAGISMVNTGLQSGKGSAVLLSYHHKQHLKASSLIFNTNGGEFKLQTPADKELVFSLEIWSAARLM